ncbi:thioredoxin reductase [Plasmodium gaboni]|uniref:Thioredoxin reductase n=1 Tax=Plasmodium gaboni TaxID=647221 RepID=A0ABY1UMP7_9APIC|nr:thioredoxin reductase [Plasmodium gaboni]
MNNVITFIGNSSNKHFQINQLHFIRIINKYIHSNNNLFISNSSYNFLNNKFLIDNTFQHKNKLSSIYSKFYSSIKNMCKDKNEKKNYEHVNANEKNGYLASEKNELTKNEVEEHTYDYDYVVIGGGPGGMASAKEAAAHGARVLLFDYVKPSSQGTKWGIGGTCVNVGCVPKKLMHYAGHMGSIFKLDSKAYGWKFDNLKHDWKKLVTTVQSHIRSLNFSYMTGLRSSKVKYINALAKLKDKNTVTYYLKGDLSKEETVTGKYILIATGCRPHIPDDVEGAKELSITSDDIFSLKKDPGKTLVVGASYVALECSGFLNSLGYDVTVAVRSIVLRGFDQQCAIKVKLYMEEQGVMFKNGILPKKLTKMDDKILVEFSDKTSELYDTVLYAIGRKGDIDGLNLESLNMKINKSNNKIIADNVSCTNIPSIFAVGDVAENVPELAPVAIKAGEILARRLFKNSDEIMDYSYIPTSIYTPIEYGACGYSEEKAYELYGKSNVEVFLQEFNNLEISAVHRQKHIRAQKDEYDLDVSSTCLAKLVCLKNEDNRVIGFHYVGPNAGEVTQGMALALRLNVKKKDFDNCIGIHPTDAESFMNLFVTISSGLSYAAKGGCGGGKCG